MFLDEKCIQLAKFVGPCPRSQLILFFVSSEKNQAFVDLAVAQRAAWLLTVNSAEEVERERKACPAR